MAASATAQRNAFCDSSEKSTGQRIDLRGQRSAAYLTLVTIATLRATDTAQDEVRQVGNSRSVSIQRDAPDESGLIAQHAPSCRWHTHFGDRPAKKVTTASISS